MNTELVVRTAKLAGRLLLENGAETYRVEDTVGYICNRYGLKDVEVIALPTGTIYSFVDGDGVPHSEVIRTKVRTTNMGCVARVNDISRGLTSGRLTLEEGCAQLEALRCMGPQPLWQSLLAGALSSVIALGSVKIFGMGNQTAIITGAIMPLLPGLAITNAIRDTVNGDLVSGVARTAEALLKAVAIAAGVGVVIALWR